MLTRLAVEAERQDDFGADHWREPFHLLTAALASEAGLNPVGLTMARGQLVKALRERLRAHALWRAHPEIADVPITAPIVVLGSMRSGTTRIQRLLACDNRLAHTRLFESLSPVPVKPFAAWDARPLKAAAGLQFIRRMNPALAAIHPTDARQPDEEFGLFSLSFNGAQFETQWRVPSFARWWEARDATAVYREFRLLLQTIAWTRGGHVDRPWILKAPQFMEELDALLSVFPDARLLCLHRDPVQVVGSSASLVWHQLRVQSDTVTKTWVGAEWLGKTAHRVRAAAASRGRARNVAQLDIDFAEVDRDWRGQVARVYDFLDLALTPMVEARMEAYLGQSTAHHGHRYTLAEFGLSAAEVHRALPDGA